MPPKRWIVISAAAVMGAAALVVWVVADPPPFLRFRVSLEEASVNPTGWEWHMPPQAVAGDRPVRTAQLFKQATLTVVGVDDELYASVTCFAPRDDEAPLDTSYRFIEIKPDGRRERGRAMNMMWHPDGRSVAVYRLNWDEEDRAETAWVGLEMCPPEGKRLIAREAAAEAAAAGVSVPSLPERGEPLTFELVDVEGNPVRSADYCGKVLLVNIWATWCPPCMAKLPLLKEVYDRYHGSGLEIVAISLDRDVADPVRVYAERGIEWPLVYVADDEKTRDLWRRATDTYGIPRVVLVDREGIVQGNLRDADLAERVAAYFQSVASADGVGAAP